MSNTLVAAKVHRISSAMRPNAALATNIRTATREGGYTRRTLRRVTGTSWLRFHRMWFGLDPALSTVLAVTSALGVEARRVFPQPAATA